MCEGRSRSVLAGPGLIARCLAVTGRVLVPMLVTALAPALAAAPLPESLTAPYTSEQCPSCAGWNEPQPPFRIHGSTYYVGTRGLSALLITSSEGHVLLDAGLPESAPLILGNVRALGFDPADIVLILNSHAHYDHGGGIAAMQHVSAARVLASPASAQALERGSGGPEDPQYGLLLEFPAVPVVERLAPGVRLTVGSHELVPHPTAGHSPGGTTWSWASCEGANCVRIVYADSLTPISAEGFRYSNSATYPDALADFERGFAILERLACDILVTTHPVSSSLWERFADGAEGLIDPQACRRYAGTARQQLARRLEQESATGSHQGEPGI